MSNPSPILEHLQVQEPGTLLWGGVEGAPEVIGSFGELEIEYATLRRSCVLVDEPQRGVIEVAGADGLEFLDRMLTQKLDDLRPGSSRASFWLNRQGRIVADLRVIVLEDRVLLDVDVSVAGAVARTLGEFVFTEDLTIHDVSAHWHRFAIHGPESLKVLSAAADAEVSLEPGQAARVSLAAMEIILDRCDLAGEPGVEVFVRVADAWKAWDAIVGAAELAGIALRPVGWHAFNIARVESGTPAFHLDFGPDSFPAETGVLDSRVSFVKGCYLGQEIVARMHSRGNPKQQLVGLRLNAPDDVGDWQPVTGTPVFAGDEQVGAVTSSSISPMLGGEPICFAMVRWAESQAGTVLALRDGEQAQDCTVQPGLRFWPRRSKG
jgi:folate-binding protein YgfZ